MNVTRINDVYDLRLFLSREFNKNWLKVPDKRVGEIYPLPIEYPCLVYKNSELIDEFYPEWPRYFPSYIYKKVLIKEKIEIEKKLNLLE